MKHVSVMKLFQFGTITKLPKKLPEYSVIAQNNLRTRYHNKYKSNINYYLGFDTIERTITVSLCLPVCPKHAELRDSSN